MFYTSDEADIIYASLLMKEGLYMSKKKYDETMQKLKEQEGAVYAIPEVSQMTGIDQETIHFWIRSRKAKTFKVRNYKTQVNQTLLPKSEIEKLLVSQLCCMRMLRTLRDIGDGDETLSNLVDRFEKFFGRS